MNEHDIWTRVIALVDAQTGVNEAVAKALRAMALTADRYDAEIAELREEVASLGLRLDRELLRNAGYRHVPGLAGGGNRDA